MVINKWHFIRRSIGQPGNALNTAWSCVTELWCKHYLGTNQFCSRLDMWLVNLATSTVFWCNHIVGSCLPQYEGFGWNKCETCMHKYIENCIMVVVDYSLSCSIAFSALLPLWLCVIYYTWSGCQNGACDTTCSVYYARAHIYGASHAHVV